MGRVLMMDDFDVEIGVGLLAFGLSFMILGVLLLFDKGLIAIGDVLLFDLFSNLSLSLFYSER